jgi:hypothetical protein
LLAWTLLPLLPTGPGGNPDDPHSPPTHLPTLHGHGHGVVLLRPPSSPHLLGLGAAPRCRVALTGDPEGAIRPRFELGFTTPFLFISLVRNPSLPSPLDLALRGQRSTKKKSFPLASAQNEFFHPPSYFLSLHDSTPFSLPRIACHPGQYCVLYCEFMFDYLLLRYMWCGGT